MSSKMKRKTTFKIETKTHKPNVKGHNHSVENGEPVLFDLDHFEGDESLRGDVFWSCCDCGLRHHHVYEVRQTLRSKEAYMVVRSYRDNYGTELIQHSRDKKRKK